MPLKGCVLSLSPLPTIYKMRNSDEKIWSFKISEFKDTSSQEVKIQSTRQPLSVLSGAWKVALRSAID